MRIRVPYGRQSIDASDVKAVSAVLRSDWLTQGPKVPEFEGELSGTCGAKYAVAYANGTAALHAAYFAAGLKAGDEVITSPITFASTATAAIWQGAKVVFADVDPETGNLSPEDCARKITKRTRAIVPVDYAGHPALLDEFRALARKHKLWLIEDACHALGASYKGKMIGSVSDMSVFSFHPVKSITTGEGGAVTTDKKAVYERLLRFRTHGIERGRDWEYAVQERALNYRLTDLQSALGISQLRRLDSFIEKRRKIAARYHEWLLGFPELEVHPVPPEASAWHLYVIRLKKAWAPKRRKIFQKLREAGVGVQVHYIPVYWHPYYKSLGYKRGLCPRAEDFYSRILSLPVYPDLSRKDQDWVVKTLRGVLDKA